MIRNWTRSGFPITGEDSCFLYMGRLLEGFGVGINSYTVPVYIAEIAPQTMVGSLGYINQLAVTIGIMLAYFLGLFVNWRVLAVIVQAQMGMTDDFEASLQVLRGFDTDITQEVNEIKIGRYNNKKNQHPVSRSSKEKILFPSYGGDWSANSATAQWNKWCIILFQ